MAKQLDIDTPMGTLVVCVADEFSGNSLLSPPPNGTLHTVLQVKLRYDGLAVEVVGRPAKFIGRLELMEPASWYRILDLGGLESLLNPTKKQKKALLAYDAETAFLQQKNN